MQLLDFEHIKFVQILDVNICALKLAALIGHQGVAIEHIYTGWI